MFTPNNARSMVVVAFLAVAFLMGCAKPPEPCTITPADVEAAEAKAKRAEDEMQALQGEIKDLEAEYAAKTKKLKELEAQKAELDELKAKVEKSAPPKR
jgi:septal ring factor EnvC (AmiA/AmiB activator)